MNKTNETVERMIDKLSKHERKIAFLQLSKEFLNAGKLTATKNVSHDFGSTISYPGLEDEKFTKGILVETTNGAYLVPPDDKYIGIGLRHCGEGPTEQEYLSNFISSRTKMLIVGAHIGTLTIPFSRLVRSVTAVEANPRTYNLLKYNLAINETKNCEAFNFAANDKSGDLEFLLNTENSGGSKRKPIEANSMYYYDNPEQIVVPAFRLDDFFYNKNFDVILIDIEGSEYFALKCMQRIISSCKILIVEFLPHHLRNVSGISVEAFLETLPGFKTMIVPRLRIRVNKEKFAKILNYMFENDIGDENLIFIK